MSIENRKRIEERKREEERKKEKEKQKRFELRERKKRIEINKREEERKLNEMECENHRPYEEIADDICYLEDFDRGPYNKDGISFYRYGTGMYDSEYEYYSYEDLVYYDYNML